MYNNGMSIQEVWGNFKDFISKTDTILAGIIITTAIVSFVLGRYSVINSVESGHVLSSNPPQILKVEDTTSTSSSSPIANSVQNQQYVASKTGTKYHLPWCAGAKQMKEENKIWFNTKEEAEKAGYLPASNCKGI